MPAVSSQLPLEYGVSEVTRNKIWTNQYAEFFDLLYPSKSTDLVMGFRKNADSTDIIVKSDKAKEVKTIYEWNSCLFDLCGHIHPEVSPRNFIPPETWRTCQATGTGWGQLSLWSSLFHCLRPCSLHRFTAMCEDTGIPIAIEKTFGPSMH